MLHRSLNFICSNYLYVPLATLKTTKDMQKELSQQLNMIMGKMSPKPKWPIFPKASKKKDESSKLLKLLKKTQTQVSSLENEIKRIKAENIHQDRNSQNDLFKINYFKYLFNRKFSL